MSEVYPFQVVDVSDRKLSNSMKCDTLTSVLAELSVREDSPNQSLVLPTDVDITSVSLVERALIAAPRDWETVDIYSDSGQFLETAADLSHAQAWIEDNMNQMNGRVRIIRSGISSGYTDVELIITADNLR